MKEPLYALLGFLVSTARAQNADFDYEEVKLGSSNRRNFDDDILETYDYTYDTVRDSASPASDLPIAPPEPARRRLPPRKPAFNPNSLFREPPQRVSAVAGPEGCKSRARTVPHESSCDMYYQCFEGQSLLQRCPNGLMYKSNGRAGLVGVCDYPHNVQCNGDRNPPQSTEHCDWLYGIFGHETSCTRYWTCWNGTATEQFCIGGLLYNEETHSCDWPQNVAGCQKHPLCKDDANGNVPLGKSCNRYWACQGGYPRLQRCPAMLVFDKNRKRCVSPPTEDCDIPTTRAPPRDEQGDETQPRSPNPRRGGGRPQRRPQAAERQPQPLSTNSNNNQQPPLPFNLPAGAVPFNSN